MAKKKKKYKNRLDRNKKLYNKYVSVPVKNKTNKIIIVFFVCSILINIVLGIGIFTGLIGKEKIKEIPKIEEKEIVPDNYLFLGDSITEYYDLGKYFIDLPVVNSGISGDTTDDILSNMKERVYDYNPSKIFLLIGTNDLEIDKSVDEVVDDIKEIVKGIKDNRPKAEIYIESVYPVNSDINEDLVDKRENEDIIAINEELEEYAEEENLTYIDIYNLLVTEDGVLNTEYTKDGLHLNDKGYDVVTKTLEKYLK